MNLSLSTSAATPRLPYARSFAVDENDAVINVNPSIVVDGSGFLVVDVSESQVRRYDDDGHLLWHAGRQGRGPGEFTAPTAIARMASGEVVVAERNGRLTFLDSAGARTLRTVETRLAQVEEMVVVDESTLLLSGVGKDGLAGNRLHLWDTRRDTLLHSFFSPFPHQRNRTAATVAGFVEASVRNDTIAAVFAASDSVYFFTRDGQFAGNPIPLASDRFRPVPEREPGHTITNPRERAEWVSSFDLVADVSWLPDGSLLVAYQRLDADRALNRLWHLVRMTRDGTRTSEVQQAFTRLLGTDPANGNAYLVDEAAEAPNEWSVLPLLASSR